MQAPPLGPVVPTLQVQSSWLSLPAGELDAAGHDAHKVDVFAPTFVLKVPAGHCIAAAVLEEPSSRPVYKCKCQTSLITTSASDLLVADATKFWEFCYANKSFARVFIS